MGKLIRQIFKFGIVGVICFFIDFGLYNFCNFIGIHYLISGFVGFSVSVIVNYLLSMRYVFKRRSDISRIHELVVFILLSIGGMILNEIILWVIIDIMYVKWGWLNDVFSYGTTQVLAKLASTGIVMIYNFVTRKIFLEDHAAYQAENNPENAGAQSRN